MSLLEIPKEDQDFRVISSKCASERIVDEKYCEDVGVDEDE